LSKTTELPLSPPLIVTEVWLAKMVVILGLASVTSVVQKVTSPALAQLAE
jgi:hypothetical protein